MGQTFKHKKAFGQNFLNDKNVILETVDLAQIGSEDTVLEIGPGEGVLTEVLLNVAKKVICIEIDERLYPVLEKKFGHFSHFHLIKADVLEINLADLLSEKSVVVANIPYYITSPIVQKIIQAREKISRAFLMVQKEVGERLAAKVGKKDRGILTLSVELFGQCHYHFTVDKEKFTPAPKVDSAIIELSFFENSPYLEEITEKAFFHVVKAGFSQKRKKMINNLSGMLNVDKSEMSKIFENLGLDENIRAEAVSIDQFVSITKQLKGYV